MREREREREREIHIIDKNMHAHPHTHKYRREQKGFAKCGKGSKANAHRVDCAGHQWSLHICKSWSASK